MEQLPVNIFVNIIRFLNVDEIYSKLTLSKNLQMLLQNKQVQRLIIANYYPQELLVKVPQNEYFNCIQSLKNMVQQEIPFWGIETNGGLTASSLRFWIGKSFLNTNGQQVSIIKLDNSYISGTLAEDQLNLKNALVKYTQKFIEIKGIEQSWNFYTSDSQNVSAENIKIFELFQSFYQLDDIEDYTQMEGLNQLSIYSYSKNLQIFQMISEDFYNLIDDDHDILPNVISFIQGVKINRNTTSDKIIKTILLITSEDQYIKQNQIYNLKTVEQLQQLIIANNNQYRPSQTNIPLIKQFCDQDQFDNSNQQEYLYCTFKPIGNCSPLIWFQFVNPNLKDIFIRFNEQTQRLAKSIQIRFFDVHYQEQFQYNGISFGYFSMLGHLLDSKNFLMHKLY